MNTTLRTSRHTCIVTRQAVDWTLQHLHNPVASFALMPEPDPQNLVCLKTIVPPHIIPGGHLHAVFELTERVDQ